MHPRETLRILERVVEAEGLRTTVQNAVVQHGQHLAAGLIGITRSSLRKFLALSEPRSQTLERLREWALDRPEPEVAPGSVGLVLLSAEFPAPYRPWARRRLAQTLAAMHAAVGTAPPDWLVEECRGHPQGAVGNFPMRLHQELRDTDRDC